MADISKIQVPGSATQYNIKDAQARRDIEDVKADLAQVQTGVIVLESGTFIDANGTSKKVNSARIRNRCQLAINNITSIIVPSGYEAYFFRLNINGTLISAYQNWLSGKIPISHIIVNGTEYLNFVIRNKANPSGDISSDVGTVQNAFALVLITDELYDVVDDIETFVEVANESDFSLIGGRYANYDTGVNVANNYWTTCQIINKNFRKIRAILTSANNAEAAMIAFYNSETLQNSETYMGSEYAVSAVNGTSEYTAIVPEGCKAIRVSTRESTFENAKVHVYTKQTAKNIIQAIENIEEGLNDEQGLVEEIGNQLVINEFNSIVVESGTFSDADGTTKTTNVNRIRNKNPILVSDAYNIQVPNGYEAWIFYLDENLEKIRNTYSWVSGVITKALVRDAIYINIAFRNRLTPNSNISGEIDDFQRSFILKPAFDSQIRLTDFKNSFYPYSMRNSGSGWSSRINLLHISDCHIGQAASLYNFAESVSVGNELYSENAIHAVINTGDMTNGMTYTKEKLLSELGQFTDIMRKSTAPYLALLGNHDANDYTSNDVANIPTKSDLWTNFYSLLSSNNIVWGDSGNSGYCYYDVTNGTLSIRIIMLDMIDHPDYTEESVYNCQENTVYSQEQIDWLAETALDVPDGYGVIICNHFPFAPYRYSGYSEQYPALNDGWFVQSDTGDKFDGWKMIPEIVQAWQNRTTIDKTYHDTIGTQDIVADYDFSNVGENAEFICYLTGHTHSKNVFVVRKENGVSFNQLMMCEDSSGQNGTGLNRTYKKFGSLVDNAFSVLSVDMVEKKIYRSSYGAYVKCSSVDSKRVEVFSYDFSQNQ